MGKGEAIKAKKINAQAKLIRKISKKSGFSQAFIHTALRLGIYGAYDFFNNVKK